jgi:hypothetical protein
MFDLVCYEEKSNEFENVVINLMMRFLIFFVDFFFFSKSLIKLTKNRIDVIRRKRKATEKFLKKDIADLLANGLDVNAYGRVIAFCCYFCSCYCGLWI